MKRCIGWPTLLGTALLVAVTLVIASRRAPDAPLASDTSSRTRPAVRFTLSAVIDGSDRFVFTRDTVWNEHHHWGPPQKVFFNGEPWTDLTVPPDRWTEMAKDLDLGRASIVTRNGRDVIALEHTADGFDLYFADSPPGAAPYEVTVCIPHK